MLITKIQGCYVAQCEQLTGAITQGDTLPETIENIKEAIELLLECEQSEGIVRIRKSLCTKLKVTGILSRK